MCTHACAVRDLHVDRQVCTSVQACVDATGQHREVWGFCCCCLILFLLIFPEYFSRQDLVSNLKLAILVTTTGHGADEAHPSLPTSQHLGYRHTLQYSAFPWVLEI